jgi:hypothetical protein
MIEAGYAAPEMAGRAHVLVDLLVKECATIASEFSIENKRIHPDVDPQDMPMVNRMVYHSTCQGVAAEIRDHFASEVPDNE